MELERVVFFTDAVMAIAITLLVVEISIPAATDDVGDALPDRWPQLLSFLVIGILWMAHHRIFRSRSRRSRSLRHAAARRGTVVRAVRADRHDHRQA